MNRLLLALSLFFLLTACNTSQKSRLNRDKDTSTKLRQRVSKEGQKYVGTNYQYAGKNPKGFDCSGFTSYVMKKFDVTLSASSSTQATQGKKIPIKKVQKGDLVFFGRKGKISHVALVVSNTQEGIRVVHSTTSRGVIVENISKSSYWKPKILFAKDVLSKE